MNLSEIICEILICLAAVGILQNFPYSIVESLEEFQNRAIASFLSAIAVSELLNLKQLTDFECRGSNFKIVSL